MHKLLSINNYYYRRDGSEVVYLEHNQIFERLGWQVIPFSMHHPDNLYTRWSEFFITEIDYGRPYSLLEKISRIPKVIYSLEARRNIGRLIDIASPDISHCHSIYHHISPSILDVLRERRIPVVMTLHDLKIACPAYHMFCRQKICERCKSGRLHNLLRQRCIKGSFSLSALLMIESALHSLRNTYLNAIEQFIVPCRFYRKKFEEWGWPGERITYIPNFIDTTRYEADYRPGKAFLYFGRLSPEKGLINLIKACGIANVPLILAGDGPQALALKEQAVISGADVVFLGRLKDQELWRAVRSARATVLPSEWYENAPMSILESYALGKPVIGADIGGIPEMVFHSHTGFLFESGSLEGLTDALRRMAALQDTEIVRMGREARKLVESKFSAEQYCEQIMALYEQLRSRKSMVN